MNFINYVALQCGHFRPQRLHLTNLNHLALRMSHAKYQYIWASSSWVEFFLKMLLMLPTNLVKICSLVFQEKVDRRTTDAAPCHQLSWHLVRYANKRDRLLLDII